jgi:hypothetical protein
MFERSNQTLLDMARSTMSQTNLLLSFWAYTLETVAFTLNRVPTKSIERTPYRYGLESVLNYLSSNFRDVRLMSNVSCQTSSPQNQTNVSLWAI